MREDVATMGVSPWLVVVQTGVFFAWSLLACPVAAQED